MGGGTAVAETPEMERVKRNQQNISTVYCGLTLPQPFPSHHVPWLFVLGKIARGYSLSINLNLHSLHFKFILINTSF